MEPIHQQADANKLLEGGIFYPTGHIVLGFADSAMAARARVALLDAGFDAKRLLAVTAEMMASEARANLADHGMLGAGSALPVRQKQLEMAEDGVHFLIVHAPEDADVDQLLAAVHAIPLHYAVRYRRLVIENLVPKAEHSTANSEPARVP